METFLTVLTFGIPVILVLIVGIWALSLRRVVETNEVHIVQGKTTISYGRGQDAGNTYYHWPSWIPVLGVQVIKLPLSMFEISLKDYAAYDKEKVPFNVDISAFLKVEDSSLAAQSISNLDEFMDQMRSVVQGSVRAILGNADIKNILVDRKDLSESFTEEVTKNLEQWGVKPAKNIEFMDIRDSAGSNVIENIRAEKVSEIEKDSRIKVANNQKAAKIAEIDATRETMIKDEEAKQQVGTKQAEVQQQIGISREQSDQAIIEQRQVTTQKQVEVDRVKAIGEAEIQRDTQIIKADEDKRTSIINAEAEGEVRVIAAEAIKRQTITQSEGDLTAKQNEAAGIERLGNANAAAIEAKGLAEIEPQIALAREIGENEGYQEYLIKIEVVKKDQAVGIAQANALEKADLKIIANSGSVTEGVQKFSDIFTTTGGGQAVGSAIEGFAATPYGQQLISKVLGLSSDTDTK